MGKRINKSFLHSKLIKILMILEKKVIKNFQKKVEEKSHKKRDAVLLLQYLKAFHPKYDESVLDKEMVFKEVFKKVDYNYFHLMKAISKLYQELKAFLSEQFFLQDAFSVNYALAKAFVQYNLYGELKRHLTKQYKIDYDAGTIWYNLRRMQWLHLDYFEVNSAKLTQDCSTVANAMHHSELFFIGSQLKYACELES